MKEIIAIVRMNKTGATKKALLDIGIAGFTGIKVMGRGKLVEDKTVIEGRKANLLALASDEDNKEAESLIEGFLDGTRLFPRRMFTVITHDDEAEKVVEAIMKVNKTSNNVGDGKIFVLPIGDVIRVRTGESGEEAI